MAAGSGRAIDGIAPAGLEIFVMGGPIMPHEPRCSSSGQSPVFSRTLLGALWTGNLFAPFLMSAVAALLPALGRDLGASAVELSLIIVVYTLAQAVFNLVGGRLGDLWGRRRMLLAGVLLFTAVTAAIGTVSYLPVLLGLRFVQGAGAALISSCTMAIAMSLAPASRRGRIMGMVTSAVYLGLSAGPVAGGAIAARGDWRWLFWSMVVPGLAVWLVLRRFIRTEWRHARGESLDVPGCLILLAGLSGIALGAGGMGMEAWLVWLALPGLCLLGLFVWWESRARVPLLDVRAFRAMKGVGAGMAAMFVNYGSTMGLVFLFSLYLQHVRGFSPYTAGLMLVVQSLAQMLSSPLGGRLADNLGAERVSAGAMALCGAGILVMAFLGKDSPPAVLIASQVVLGVGIGCFSAPNVVATLGRVPPRHLAVASGLIGSMRTLGGLFSQVFITLVLGHYMGEAGLDADSVDSFLTAMRVSLVGLGLLNLGGILIGVSRVRSDAGSAA
ncbi:MAG: MFS transporter [Desulfovibrionaceae bacterium]|nr:MFS transporter [Desulfovibrionaceae bacterium]